MNTEDRIDEIDEQIQDLRNKRFYLSKQLMAEQQEKLKVLVGACVIKKGTVYKVIDVPQEQMLSVGFEFNPYQIPVVVLEDDTIDKTTLFSRAVNFDDPLKQFYEEYQTCTKDHFNRKLESIVEKLKS